MAAFSIDGVVTTLLRDGTSDVVDGSHGPVRVDGYSVGVIPVLDRPAPHRGEMHPDGDEYLYIASGHVQVILDDGDAEHVGTEAVYDVRAGEAFVVPQGVWHRIDIVEAAHLVHVTPGPGSGHRPL